MYKTSHWRCSDAQETVQVVLTFIFSKDNALLELLLGAQHSDKVDTLHNSGHFNFG